MKKEIIGGALGSVMSAVGTATQTNEILQTISLIITIIGALISMIVVPLISWFQKAKQDGKITKDEIQEGLQTLQDGIGGVKDTLKDKEEKK